MTTVAFKDGILAADRQVSQGNRVFAEIDKVFQVSDTLFVGVCGTVSSIHQFLRWMEKHENFKQHMLDKPDTASDANFDALIVDSSDKSIWCIDQTYEPYPIYGDIFAIGSGADIAIGAMAAGASAKKAIQIASKYDITTGIAIQMHKVW